MLVGEVGSSLVEIDGEVWVEIPIVCSAGGYVLDDVVPFKLI